MVRGVTIAEALELKERFAAVPGVEAVTWLDDAVDMLVPLELQDADEVESYYKDGAALFTLTISDAHRIDRRRGRARDCRENGRPHGDAVSTADATTGTVAEVRLITVIAVLFVWLVLTLTTTSWAEPIVVLIGLGVATVLNAGSNLIFGEISFVTQRRRQRAAARLYARLQRIPYTPLLRVLDEKPDPREAMVNALCKSTTSIMSAVSRLS